MHEKFNGLNSKESTEEQERHTELTAYVNELNIDGLSVGIPQELMRIRGSEHVGIYIDGEHRGDVHSEPPLNFDCDYFKYTVAELLGDNVEIVIDQETNQRMNQFGMMIHDQIITLTNDPEVEIDLYNNGENKKIVFISGKNPNTVLMQITEKAGTVIQYRFISGGLDDESRTVLTEPGNDSL